MDQDLLHGLRTLIAEAPFYRWNQIEVSAAEAGAVTLTLDLQEHHLNVQGLAHGGVLATIADAAMGLSIRTALEPGRRHVTIEMGMHYLRPVIRGQIIATGRAVRVGREIAYAEAEVTDAGGRVLVRASGTYSVTRAAD